MRNLGGRFRMNKNATSATDDSMNVDAYYESLILDAVAQADGPLHEALVRSSVYRTINDSYERALAQLVIDGELLYAKGEYSLAPDAAVEVAEAAGEPLADTAFEPEAVEPDAESEDAETEAAESEVANDVVVDDESVEPEAVEPEAIEVADEPEDSEHVQSEADEVAEIESVDADVPEPMDAQPEAAEPTTAEAPAPKACGPISLHADSTLVQLKVNERSWPIPVAVGVSYDKKPADGLSLMGYEPPSESAEASAEQRELAQVEQQEPTQSGRPELTLTSEPQQLAISFSDSIESVKAVTEPAPAAEPEQPALALESEPEPANELASVEEPVPEPEAMPASALKPTEAAVNKPERPKYLSGWDDPRCVFDSETQVAFLDKQKIRDVFSLVRELGGLAGASLRVAFEQRLGAFALPLSPQYRAQAPELGKLSGNDNFAFDVFGNLRSIGSDCRVYANVKGPITEALSTVYTSEGQPLSLLNLPISPALQRKLKRNLNINNLPELLMHNRVELRAGGLVSQEIHSINDALGDWSSGRLQLGKTEHDMKIARLSAIGGWYPAAQTPLDRIETVNKFADEALARLQQENLVVNTPSFRLLFCTRLAGKLAEGRNKQAAASSTLAAFKGEYPAYNAAIKAFERLGFAPFCEQKDIDSANSPSACEPNQPELQDITLEKALELAINRNAVNFNRWFADLLYEDRILLAYMLIEDKPEKWLSNINKSAEYIRERFDLLMVGRPRFDVDAFGSLFKMYELSAEEFYGLTQTAQPAFLYMRRVYGQGAIPLKYAGVDKDLEPSVRQVVRAYLALTANKKTNDRAAYRADSAERAAAPAPEPKYKPKHASVQEQAPVPEPVPKPEQDPEPAPKPEPAPDPEPVSKPALTPAPQQPIQPFTSKIEDLTGKGPMSIEAWLALLSDDDADLLRWIFSDKPLMDYPHKPAGLGPLRQRRADLLRNRPRLDEDKFAPLYQRYDLTEDAFCKITLASPMTFGYLKAVKVSNKFSLRLAANDRTLPQEWRERIAQLNRRPVADALRTPASTEESNATQLEQIARKKIGNLSTRSVALRVFAESGAVKEYHNLKDFRNRYQLFLEENKCGYKMTLALPSDDIRCLNELRGTHMFLVARANKIRAYKVDSRFTSELRQILTLAVGRNIECGAGLILRENQELCDLYDVRDDEELYEIIRSFVRPDLVPGLEMGAMPLIRLGKVDRKTQMLNVLRDAGTELSREDFAQMYADTYCISKVTVRNNYLRDLNAYLRNGRYSYVDNDLTAEQQQFITDMVTEDYVSLPYVTASFAAKFGAASGRLVNDQSLAPLGLEISRDLIVREGVDLRQSFTNLLMSRDSFAYGSPGFGDEVITHPEFRNAITPLLRNFTFIECNHDSFISLKRLSESMGIRRFDLGSYACSLFARTEPSVPFTVTSLRKQGFMHKLDAVVDECGFDNSFYDSIVLYGLAHEQIRRTRFSGVYMFCRKEGTFSSGDAVEYVVRQKGPIEVGDLIDAFQDDYGVVITAADINRAVQDKGLFYNEDLDMVMLSKRMNAEYLRKLYIKNNQ